MKKVFNIFLFIFPALVSAQQPWRMSNSLDNLWMNVGNAGFSMEPIGILSFAISPYDSQPYVAFNDNGNSYKATVMKFDGSNWVNVGPTGFSSGAIVSPSIAFSPMDSLPYLAFSAWGDSCKGATVMKFDGTNWIYVGNQNFSSCSTDFTSLAFSPSDGQPYVAYKDGGNSYKATVMKFDGNNWQNVGIAGFSAHSVDDINLAFSSYDSLPYVSYSERINYYEKATVMKFNGTNWINVGEPGFSASFVNYTSLAISPLGEPYVVYRDWANLYKSTVMKFDGSQWVTVGDAGFSIKEVVYTTIKFNPFGQPYVAFSDYGVNWRMVVMKFDGISWVYVGNAGFSAGTVVHPCLAFSTTDDPFVAYTDNGYGNKATVMKYDSVAVGFNEPLKTAFTLFPNPTTNTTTIHFCNDTNKFKIVELSDMRGAILLNLQTYEDEFSFNLENYPSGIYLVKIIENKDVFVTKIFKK